MTPHLWLKGIVYAVASLPLGLLLLQFVMARYLDLIGIHYSYIKDRFAGLRTFYDYNRLARSNQWPMWPLYLHWIGTIAFAIAALIFIVW